jgi:hypothetical protein
MFNIMDTNDACSLSRLGRARATLPALDDTARLPLPAALRVLADILSSVAAALRRIAAAQARGVR